MLNSSFAGNYAQFVEAFGRPKKQLAVMTARRA
jgi:hypothetical protein